MKTVLLLGGPAAGQRVEVHGCMTSWLATPDADYRVVPMCSHGEVHWFGVLDGADPLALLIAGYGMNVVPKVERSAVCPPALAAAVYGVEPTRVEVHSATKIEVDRFGAAHAVPDIRKARELLGQGFVQTGPNTFRKEFYE